MARVNLRAAFMSGLDSPVTAQQVFADRADETSAFQAAIRNLEQELDRAGDQGRARHTLHDLDPDEVRWPEITWLDGPDKTLRRWARVAR